MATRADLIRAATVPMGGRYGTVLSGNDTTLVLNGLIGTTGDDNAYAGDLLFMLDAASELDRERQILTWDDSEGEATVAVRSTGSPANESYILVERNDYTLAEYRAALNQALTKTPRSYQSVLALSPNSSLYPLSELTWLEGAGDVDQAVVSTSPNALHNEDFSLWQTYTAPDSWTLDGTATRVAGFGVGGYAVQITNDDGDASITQSMPAYLVQFLARVNTARETVRAAAWVTCNVPSSAAVGINDGSGFVWSDFHTGSGHPEYLDVSITSQGTDTDYQIAIAVNEGDTATVERAALYPGTALDTTLRDYGSQGYHRHVIEPSHIKNVGGVPRVELPEWWSAPYGQLVVTSRRPFSEMTADDDEIDDQYARTLEAGLLRWLLEASKKNQDRTRLDRVMTEQGRRWARLAGNLVDLPVAKPANRIEVWGA